MEYLDIFWILIMFDLLINELYALPCYDGPYCNETRMHIDRYLCKLLSGDTWQMNAFFQNVRLHQFRKIPR